MQAGLRSLLSDPSMLRRFRVTSRYKARSFDLSKIVAEYTEVMAQILQDK